jgi:hypothetical protein
MAGVHLDPRMGKVSSEGFKRGMLRVPSAVLVSACRLAFDGDFGPIIQSIFDRFWPNLLRFPPNGPLC